MSTTHIYKSNVWHVSILFSRSGSALTRFIPPQQCPLARNYPDRDVISRLCLTVSPRVCGGRKPGMNLKLMNTRRPAALRHRHYQLHARPSRSEGRASNASPALCTPRATHKNNEGFLKRASPPLNSRCLCDFRSIIRRIHREILRTYRRVKSRIYVWRWDGFLRRLLDTEMESTHQIQPGDKTENSRKLVLSQDNIYCFFFRFVLKFQILYQDILI